MFDNSPTSGRPSLLLGPLGRLRAGQIHPSRCSRPDWCCYVVGYQGAAAMCLPGRVGLWTAFLALISFEVGGVSLYDVIAWDAGIPSIYPKRKLNMSVRWPEMMTISYEEAVLCLLRLWKTISHDSRSVSRWLDSYDANDLINITVQLLINILPMPRKKDFASENPLYWVNQPKIHFW